MAFTYETIETLIPNATMQKAYNNGTFLVYRIYPNEGYALHDTQYDTLIQKTVIDEETGEEIIVDVPALGYHTYFVTCGANYAFDPVQMQDDDGNTVTAYGTRQFFCKLLSEIPENQIFGVTNPPVTE